MQTVLVTGGAGYIGSHTIVALIESGFNVISADNFLKSNGQAFVGIEKITGKKVINYDIDLCNYEASKIIFNENKIDAVIHFAALKSVPESLEKPLWYYQNNIDSLVNILKLCEANGVQQFVFSSSCSVYGNATDLPVTEKTTLMPVQSVYAQTKLIGENILTDFSSTSSMQIIKLRYFNPVGAHSSGLIGETSFDVPNNLVPLITLTAAGKIEKLKVFGYELPTRDGTCIRDYIHVMDLADAHICALQYLKRNENVKLEMLNIGIGNGTTVLEAIQSFEKVSGVKLNYELTAPRAGDVVAIYCDNSLAKEKLQWTPQFSLEDMMRSAWHWQLASTDY